MKLDVLRLAHHMRPPSTRKRSSGSKIVRYKHDNAPNALAQVRIVCPPSSTSPRLIAVFPDSSPPVPAANVWVGVRQSFVDRPIERPMKRSRGRPRNRPLSRSLYSRPRHLVAVVGVASAGCGVSRRAQCGLLREIRVHRKGKPVYHPENMRCESRGDCRHRERASVTWGWEETRRGRR